MKNIIIVSLLAVFAFGGCSAKEFNERVDSLTGDVSEKFEEGVDHSERPQ